MRLSAFLATVFATVLILVLPFFGGGGPSLNSVAANANSFGAQVTFVVQPLGTPPVTALAEIDVVIAALRQSESTVVTAAVVTAVTTDSEHLAQKPVPPPPPPVTSKAGKASGTDARQAARAAVGQSCPGAIGGGTGGAPGVVSGAGVQGTTSSDIASFASNYNAIRVANCLNPVPMGNFRYDSCMEQRLFWLAEDPHALPNNTWGHIGVRSTEADANGVYYSDAVPSSGCDGNLAGGSGMSGAGAADRWWASTAHRNSLYRPANTGATGGVCIFFAMTHGDGNLGGEPYSFTRAAARYGGC